MNIQDWRDTLTPEELKEYARRGGIASGEARRERRALRQELEELLTVGDVQQRLCSSIIDAALSGNVRAFEVIRDTLGETIANKIDLLASTDDTIQIVVDIEDEE